ncbi:MAG: hypothetical protein LQ337_003079 [Flavoplaca oasis]|nr:MAG: hypothetical protein LQ337_003079 [Flavoplaca oasis]
MIASTLLSLRHGEYSQKPRNEPFDDIDDWLEDAETSFGVIHILDDPISALEDITTTQRDIETWTSHFIRTRCVRPTIPGAGTAALSQEEPATSSEIYRIRRALWRFWLLCQLACPITPCTVRHERHEAYMMFPFWRNLTAWELEELECIYYFLRDEYELLRVGSQGSLVNNQPPLVQKLLLIMGYRPSDIAPPKLDLRSTYVGGESLTEAAFGCRVACSREILTIWPDAPSEVHERNAGFAFYDKRMYNLYEVFSDTYYDRQMPILCCLKWGYCIWDRERLLRWGMLNTETRGGVDWMTRWSRGDSGGEGCIHRKCQGDFTSRCGWYDRM